MVVNSRAGVSMVTCLMTMPSTKWRVEQDFLLESFVQYFFRTSDQESRLLNTTRLNWLNQPDAL